MYLLFSKASNFKTHMTQVPYNKLLTNLACSSRTGVGNIGPWSFLYGPHCTRPILPQPRACYVFGFIYRRVNAHTRWRVNNKIVLIRAHGNTSNCCTLCGLIELLQWADNTNHVDTITGPILPSTALALG